MGDDQIVITSGQVLTPDKVASRTFSSAFRGYHPVEVKQFLKRVGDEMAASATREMEFRKALEEALHRAANPEIDEATLVRHLGEHASRVLADARDEAAAFIQESRREADAARHDADGRVAQWQEEADGVLARRVAEADAAAASIQAAAEQEAQAHIERAKELGKEMVAEARAVRERMLGDLSRRRRSAQLQIEQLRRRRERLVAAYDVVRRTVDEATAELDAAEPEARLAAEAVARKFDESEAGASDDVALPASSPATPPPLPPVTAAREVPPDLSLLRRVEPPAPAPERPRLRPQTVADAVASRSPAVQIAIPELIPTPRPAPPSSPTPRLAPPPAPPVAPSPLPAPPPAPEPTPTPPPAPAPAPAPAPPPPASPVELATSQVPVVTMAAPTAGVDELFARIRANRQPSEDGAPPSDPTGSDARPVETAALDPVAGESALESRDGLLDNLEAGLTRALKRVLSDEQNEILDGLRRLGAVAGAGVLPDPGFHVASYRDVAAPWLLQAARAGVGFVSDPVAGSDAEKRQTSVDHQAQALACELVEPLRERLVRSFAGAVDADDPAAVAETLRATYRQWKVQQVEECARHYVMAAFCDGAFSATPESATLVWLVDDDVQCPDCDDNALAGPTPKGEAYPTGQLHPPAHPGCRCLLVPATP